MNDDHGRLLAEFREKAQPLGVVVHRAESIERAAELVVDWAPVRGARTLVLSEELLTRSPRLGAALAQAGMDVVPPGSPAQVRDAPVGMSLAHLAVAETGSTLLAEPTLPDRAVGLLSLAQVIVAPTEALVASLDDAASALRRIATAPGASFATLVTGPSRTADIERVLTVGVQGPGAVMILFIDELERADAER